MQRRIYTAILPSGTAPETICERIFEKSLSGCPEHLSLFRYSSQIFLYYEFAGKEIHPDDLFLGVSDLLEPCPGMDGFHHWTLMHDIFHYQSPQNPEDWRRLNRTSRPFARVVRLNPEMVASYIFYHYQYQEEKPGDGDKYGIIGIHGDLLFFYCEEPAYLEKPSYKGRLSTKNTPANWSELMDRHFMEWPDSKSAEDHWRSAEVLLTL